MECWNDNPDERPIIEDLVQFFHGISLRASRHWDMKDISSRLTNVRVIRREFEDVVTIRQATLDATSMVGPELLVHSCG